MDDAYLITQGITKEKVKQIIDENKQKTIQESSLIPYVIMSIKAMKNGFDTYSEETKQAMSQLMKGLIDDFDSVITKCDANEKSKEEL